MCGAILSVCILSYSIKPSSCGRSSSFCALPFLRFTPQVITYSSLLGACGKAREIAKTKVCRAQRPAVLQAVEKRLINYGRLVMIGMLRSVGLEDSLWLKSRGFWLGFSLGFAQPLNALLPAPEVLSACAWGSGHGDSSRLGHGDRRPFRKSTPSKVGV